MKRSVVVVRPDFETATHYGQYYEAKYVIETAKQLGIPFVDLYKESARKAQFKQALSDPNAVFISGTGHGNANVFTGQNYEYLLVKGYEEDAKLVAGKWGSFLSCVFGQSADWWISKGMKGFFGYTRTYYFVVGVYPNSRAHYFFDSHHTFGISALNGKTWQECFDACIKAYNNAIGEAPYDVKYYLVWDRDSAVAKGVMDDGPFVSKAEPNLWCRFLKWLWKISKCPGDICAR